MSLILSTEQKDQWLPGELDFHREQEVVITLRNHDEAQALLEACEAATELIHPQFTRKLKVAMGWSWPDDE